MRVLITGATGLLGQEVVSAVAAAGHEPIALSHGELDITDPAAAQSAVADARPAVVVNCAAWTDVDGAEAAREQALSVNGPGAGNVARAADSSGAWTIHISSDYVFDGAKREPYVESDSPAPLSAYGASKLQGEIAVAERAPESHTIVRSSWLFGAGGPCFPKTILRLAAERDELTVVDDQVGCPTFTPHLARALATLLDSPPPGILHVAAAGQCSWFELARELVSAAGAACEIRPGATRDLQRPAPRPAYSVLRSERHAPHLPLWRTGVAEFLALKVPAQ